MRFSPALRNIRKMRLLLECVFIFCIRWKTHTRARARVILLVNGEKNTCMHGPVAYVYIRSLKGATRSDVISNAYVLPGARLALPSQFACAQRQRLQDASAEHAYISGLSSSLRGRRKNGFGENGFSRSVREVYFPSPSLTSDAREIAA